MAIEIKYSVYPFALDGTDQLPIIVDNITEVNAEVVNRLRSSIIAVQGELGIDPSGVYTTVRARLDALESLIGSGSGIGGIERVSLNGVTAVTSATELNFIGSSINVTDAGSGVADIEFFGSQQVQETIAVTVPSQTAFVLSDIPGDATAVQMFVNGIKQSFGSDYTVSGVNVTYSGSYALQVTDDVEFWYLISGIIVGPGDDLETVLSVNNITNGYDIDFTNGSAITSSDGYVTVNDTLEVNGDVYINGKLNVSGLIDPTGLVLNEQASDPASTSSGLGTVWVRNATPTTLMFTDSFGIDHNLIVANTEDIEIWVDGTSGDDSNIGDEANPLLTPDEALRRIGTTIDTNVTLKLLPSPLSTGYVFEQLWNPRTINGRLTIEGVGVIEAYPAIALTSIPNTKTYSFSAAAPGWTIGQWSGYDLEVVTSANGIAVGQKKTIVWNTADTIVVCSQFAKFPAFEVAVAGDTMRIVRPATAINTVISSASEVRTLVGGTATSITTNRSLPIPGTMRLRNIEMRIPDGSSNIVNATGAFEFFGVHITQNTTSVHQWNFQNAIVRAGTYEGTGIGTEYLYGWGLSTRARGNTIRPALKFVTSKVQLYYSGGGVMLEEGSDLLIDSGCMFDGIGRSGFPHGTLYARNSHCTTFSTAALGLYMRNFTNEFDIEAEMGWVEIYQPIHHLGANDLARARHHGQINIQVNPINVNAGTIGLYALYGGQIRLVGANGSTIGTATVGVNNVFVRPAGTWEIGEKFEGTEATAIYRSA